MSDGYSNVQYDATSIEKEEKVFDETQGVKDLLSAEALCKEIYEERNRAATALKSATQDLRRLVKIESTLEQRKNTIARLKSLNSSLEECEHRLYFARVRLFSDVSSFTKSLLQSRGIFFFPNANPSKSLISDDRPWVCSGPMGAPSDNVKPFSPDGLP